MTRSEFIKIMAAGALGAGALSRLASRTFAQPATTDLAISGSSADNATNQAWQPVPALQTEPPSPTRFVSSGPGLGNRIAITFDDGPAPGSTELVLKELEKRKITASFFMIGNNAERFPSLAKEVADAGHEICNHTLTHPALGLMPAAKAEYQIQKAQEIITNVTGHAPKWLRPPYGSFRRKDQGPIAQKMGLGVVWWSVDPLDWKKPGSAEIVRRVVSATLPGSIILLHDIHMQTAQAVGTILDQLLEKDYNFTHVSGFLGEPYGPYFG